MVQAGPEDILTKPMGVWPLTSIRNAEFMVHELRVPVPEPVLTVILNWLASLDGKWISDPLSYTGPKNVHKPYAESDRSFNSGCAGIGCWGACAGAEAVFFATVAFATRAFFFAVFAVRAFTAVFLTAAFFRAGATLLVAGAAFATAALA
jgi:hypothetical protein